MQIQNRDYLHTTPSIYINHSSGVQAETQRQEAFNLEEWMTPECLEDIAQDLELLATTQGREAVVLAAGTLTGDIRDVIEQLLLGFNVAIE